MLTRHTGVASYGIQHCRLNVDSRFVWVSSESRVTEGSSYRVEAKLGTDNEEKFHQSLDLPCWQTIFEYWLRSVRAILMPAWISDSQGYLYAACCPLEILFQRRERRGQEESSVFSFSFHWKHTLFRSSK